MSFKFDSRRAKAQALLNSFAQGFTPTEEGNAEAPETKDNASAQPQNVSVPAPPQIHPSRMKAMNNTQPPNRTDNPPATVSSVSPSIQDGMKDPHRCQGAGILNLESKIQVPPGIWQPPPWSGKSAERIFFEVFAGAECVNRFPIYKKRHFVVGRNPDVDIMVNHQLVSRHHAIILFNQSGDVFLYDLGSTHGTYVNDMSGNRPENDGLVPKRNYMKLAVGHRIMFGRCLYQFALVSDGPVPVSRDRSYSPRRRSRDEKRDDKGGQRNERERSRDRDRDREGHS